MTNSIRASTPFGR